MYICRQCGKIFKYAKDFGKHKETHKEEKFSASKHFRKAFICFSYHNSDESSHRGQMAYIQAL